MLFIYSNALNEWQAEFPHRSRETLLQNSGDVLKPVGTYYHKQFKQEGGDCYPIRQICEVVDMFNPEWLAENIYDETDIVLEMHTHLAKLKYFRYKKFDNQVLLNGMKAEMKKLVEAAKEDHDLDKIKPSRTYLTRLQERIKKKKRSAESFDFRDDAGEYSQRIFAWWKPRRDDFPYFALALRLIVLAQLSSCSVERVFSKLEQIHHVCGENLYEDMTEVRLFLQCNGDLSALESYLKKLG